MGQTFGQVGQQVKTVTTTYAAVATDDLILADATAGAFTVTLPSPGGLFNGPNSQPQQFRVQKIDVTANAVTVATAAGSIVGNALLTQQFQTSAFTPDGGAFYYNFVSAGSNGERIAQIPISSAQILAMSVTPVTLVPAQGAGTVIIPSLFTLKAVTTATQYANGGVVEFRFTGLAGALCAATIAAAVITAGAGTVFTSVAGVTTSLTPVANAPIVIDNATAPFITGTGTAVVGVSYRVLTL